MHKHLHDKRLCCLSKQGVSISYYRESCSIAHYNLQFHFMPINNFFSSRIELYILNSFEISFSDHRL